MLGLVDAFGKPNLCSVTQFILPSLEMLEKLMSWISSYLVLSFPSPIGNHTRFALYKQMQ